jgi:steroid delta-isomerase-like uncharacterized protein
MGSEETEAVARRVVDELLNGQDLEILDEVVHPDYVDGYGGFGREDYRGLVQAMWAAFPDLHIEIDQAVAQGDVVALRMTLTGTHEGEFLGIAPTGRRVSFPAAGFIEVADGKMIRRWNISDVYEVAEQLSGPP